MLQLNKLHPHGYPNNSLNTFNQFKIMLWGGGKGLTLLAPSTEKNFYLMDLSCAMKINAQHAISPFLIVTNLAL